MVYNNKMASDWHSNEAFLNDIWSYSEIEQPTCHEESVPTPTTIQEFNTRLGVNNTPSIFENMYPTDDVPVVTLGRGRGARSLLITPGEVRKPSANLEDAAILRKLRQVAGLGYSNELIEETFKAATNQFCDVPIPEIKLQPQPSTSTINSNGTASSSSMSRVDSPSNSKASSVCVSPSKFLINKVSLSNCSSRTSSPSSEEEAEPLKVTEKAPSPNPLPLSIMLNRAKKDVKKAKEGPKKGTGNGVSAVVENGERKPDQSFALNANAPEWTPDGNRIQNDFWWNRHPETSNDEANSWRRRETDSPNRFFAWNSGWNKNNGFNISSSKDFPALK